MRSTRGTHDNSWIITLGRNERALWSSRTADGRDIDEARRAVRAEADRLMADRDAVCVEVYAPAEGGGHMIEQYLDPDYAD